MASNVTIKPEQLASTIKQILDEFGDEAIAGVQRAGQKTTRETAKAVQPSSLTVNRSGTLESPGLFSLIMGPLLPRMRSLQPANA